MNTTTLNKDNQAEIPQYTVKQAAEMTGLTLNQVRLWERRYHLVSPQRGANGYRLYCENDLAILSYALKETRKGIGIQLVSEKVQTDRADILSKIKQQKGSVSKPIKADDAYQVPHLEMMLQAVQKGDPVAFERLLVEAQAGHSFAETLRSVDLPVLARIGELTTQNRLDICCSHIASAIIRRRILSHVHNLGIPKSPSKTIMLACAPNDYHELGLLCCLLDLTEQMIPTVYFGGNLPLEQLEIYAQKLNPQAILLSVVAPMPDRKAQQLTEQIRTKLLKICPVAIGGYEAEKRKHLFEDGGIQVFRNVSEIFKWRPIRTVKAA
jgi:MerR family transcriptional regulator, light-induced transcriptional regulator